MIYSNDDPMALYAMEAERTGNYGDSYYDDEDYVERCPICGAYEPEYYYLDNNEDCIGCSECIHRTETLF